MRIRRLVLALLLLPAVGLAASSGRVDATFGVGGMLPYPLTPAAPLPWNDGAVVQADGSLLTVVDGALWRHQPDGMLDGSFPNGLVPLTSLYCLRQQPDGQLLLSGIAGGVGVLRRTDPDGVPDPGFGTGGDVALGTYITCPAVMGDGRLVVPVAQPLGQTGLRLVRLLPDGGLDPSFGVGGVHDVAFSGVSVAGVQSTGHIIASVGITTLRDLWRFAPDGTRDMAFGAAGELFVQASGVLVLPDDRIVVAGPLVERYLADGTIDPGFTATGANHGARVTRQTDGRLVVRMRIGDNWYLRRLLPDGQIDTGFGGGGTVPADVLQAPSAVLEQPDGRLVVVGDHGFQATRRFGGVCADGTVEPGEDCDDGNAVDGDGCDADCCAVDADDDGWCDAVDPCVAPAPVVKPKLRYAALTGTAKGTVMLPAPALTTINPVATGLRFRITDADGDVADVTIPPGLGAMPKYGWSTRGAGRFVWRDQLRLAARGFDQVKVRTRPERGTLTFDIRSRGAKDEVTSAGNLGLVAPTFPVAAELVLDAGAVAGTCAAMRFDGPPPAPTCMRTNSGISCR